MSQRSVVPETTGVGEADFRNAMIAGLARAQQRVGSKALAFVMDMTPKALSNLFGGAAKSTDPKRLWDARAACPTALDDVADLYGCAIVSKDEAALIGRGTLPMAELLRKVAVAESPDSPGGAAVVHSELLDMEDEIRAVHALTGAWLERIREVRRPRVA